MRISLHSIMLKVLLVVVLWCVNVSSTSNDFKPIPFIHITKTGMNNDSVILLLVVGM